MSAKEKTKGKFAGLSNEHGFTLAETLLALTCFLIIVSLLPSAIGIVLQEGVADRKIQTLEWEVFNSQLKREFRTGFLIIAQKEKLLIQKGSDTILYEKYGSNIRRRVNNEGHEIMLQNVREVRFTSDGHSVVVALRDIWQKEYGSRLMPFLSAGAGV
ncbi:competence type IV pilus minor pilin ComGF [Bacillus massilinigeriensis]|uniref:competence type IV pilus minor pilin ComGF n=1 Tax=Bacillus mediterraneensis TaxID=1805474 RepID=UPI0009F4C665|nr:competence type IV pilus minor pilin ComGF [Bacillus mediterraneensis]